MANIPMSGVAPMHPLTLYALEVSRDRDRDREVRRLLAEARFERPARPSRLRLRRPAALLLAALSRGSAAAVRRLDDCVADDLGRSLSPTK
jgi:hypothetical protein